MVVMSGDTNYRRCMVRRERGLFAGGGISRLTPKAVALGFLTVVAAFLAGLLVAWLTSLLPEILEGSDEPSPTPSVTPSQRPSLDPSLAPEIDPILRELDDEDIAAGLLSLEIPYEGEGTFSVVEGSTEPDSNGPPVRWVSIEIEDGLDVDARVFSDFVMTYLNDSRGWGANDRLQYARTDGVADIRIVLASPVTATLLCPDSHAVAPDRTVFEDEPDTGPSVTPTPGITPTPQESSCAARSVMTISIYDWAAGLPNFVDERSASRVYQLMHSLGHLMGREEEECTGDQAPVMADQTSLPDDCAINPWPYPEEGAADATPEPTPEPTAE